MTDINRPIIAYILNENGEEVMTGIVGEKEAAMVHHHDGMPWNALHLHQAITSGNGFYAGCVVRYADDEEIVYMGMDKRREKLESENTQTRRNRFGH